MSKQLPLFALDDPESPDPLTLLRNGAALVLSVSAGKDSDSMTHYLLSLREREGWMGEVCMVHADLGAERVEWHQTPDYVRDLVDSNVTAK
jgi:tRNA(Ile)-lysidine synthase TilS/MesJ